MLQGSVVRRTKSGRCGSTSIRRRGRSAARASVSDTQVGHVLGRWTHTRANGATLQVQSFVDVAHRRRVDWRVPPPAPSISTRSITPHVGRRHDLVVGGGYRYINEAIDGGGRVLVQPEPRAGNAGQRVRAGRDRARRAARQADARREVRARVRRWIERCSRPRVSCGTSHRSSTCGPRSRARCGRRRSWTRASASTFRRPSSPRHPATPPRCHLRRTAIRRCRNERLVSTEAGYRHRHRFDGVDRRRRVHRPLPGPPDRRTVGADV